MSTENRKKKKNEYRTTTWNVGIAIIRALVRFRCAYFLFSIIYLYIFFVISSIVLRSMLSFSILSFCHSLFVSSIQPFIHSSAAFQRIEYIMYKLTS